MGAEGTREQLGQRRGQCPDGRGSPLEGYGKPRPAVPGEPKCQRSVHPKERRSRPRKRRRTGSLWCRKLSKKHRDIRRPKTRANRPGSYRCVGARSGGRQRRGPSLLFLSAAYPASFLYSPSATSDGISTAIRIGRLRERRLDETFPAEVSDLETELPPPAPRSSTARAHHSLAANQRCGPRPGTVTLIANLQAK